MIDFARNYFDLFGIPQRYRFDGERLEQAYRALQSEVHPDRFAGGSDAQKRIALQSSARVNEAYRALRDPVLRAQYLLQMHGVDATDETDTSLPLEFLEHQLERREAAEGFVEARDVRALSALVTQIRAESTDREAALATALDDERAFADARTKVRELTFLQKLAADLDTLQSTLDD
ncbi:MAG: Fe-S protein assembly co-chaperone HscB [Casimicrobiaceae bacterium]